MLLAAADAIALRGDLGVAQRVAWSAADLARCGEAMGHATGTTVNDIVLTAVAGPASVASVERRPRASSTVFVPFNLRPLD